MGIPEENELRELFYNKALLHGLSKNSCYGYYLSCRKMWNRFNKHPQKVTNDELENYFIEYLKGNPAKNSLRVTSAAFKFLFEVVLGEKREIIGKVKGGKSRRLPRVMSMEEVTLLLDYIEAYHYKVMITLAFNCGLRVSEVINVRTSDINKYKMSLFVLGKGNKDRYVPIPENAYLMLHKYWDAVRPLQPYMFVNPRTQKPYTRESAEAVFRKAQIALKLNSEYTFHTLRHSYATCLVEDGIDIRMLQIYLGHSSIRTTMKYIHMGVKSSAKATLILNNCFQSFSYPRA